MFSSRLAKNKKSALFNIHLFITRVVNYHQTVEEEKAKGEIRAEKKSDSWLSSSNFADRQQSNVMAIKYPQMKF